MIRPLPFSWVVALEFGRRTQPESVPFSSLFFIRFCRQRLRITVARLHGEIWLPNFYLDLAPVVAIRVIGLGIVAKAVLAAQFFGDSTEGLRELSGATGFIQTPASLVGKSVGISIRSIIIRLARPRYGNA